MSKKLKKLSADLEAAPPPPTKPAAVSSQQPPAKKPAADPNAELKDKLGLKPKPKATTKVTTPKEVKPDDSQSAEGGARSRRWYDIRSW